MKFPKLPGTRGRRLPPIVPPTPRAGGRHRLDDNPDGYRPKRGSKALTVPRGNWSGDDNEPARYIGQRRAQSRRRADSGERRTPPPQDPYVPDPPRRAPASRPARRRFGPEPYPTRQSPSDIPDRSGRHMSRADYERDQRYRRARDDERARREFMDITDREMRAQARRRTGEGIERARRRREFDALVDEELGRKRYTGRAAAPARPLPDSTRTRRGQQGAARAVPAPRRHPELHGQTYAGGPKPRR